MKNRLRIREPFTNVRAMSDPGSQAAAHEPVHESGYASPSGGKQVLDEAALIARIRNGDGAAFKAIFVAYYELVWSFVLGYVKLPEIADECAQDVFGWVWIHRGDLTVRTGIKRYLFGAARNRALDYLRHQHVRARWAAAAARDDRLALVGQGPRPTDDQLRAQELEAAVERAVARLPERRQQAYRLRMQQRLTNAETAALMGISIKGVEAALTAALKTLREELKDFF